MDRRVQKTRQALQTALIDLILERRFEDITVQDVLDKANVGRSTFYTHFYDLEDLLQSEFEVLQAEFERALAQQSIHQLWDISRVMFQHAATYQRVYHAVVGQKSAALIQGHLRAYLSQQIRDRLLIETIARKDQPLYSELLEHYLVSSLMALLTWWLDHAMPYTPEQMAQIFQELTEKGIAGL